MITEAWVRLQERPRFKLSCGVAFDDFHAASHAVREISQSGLNPPNCRLLDAAESELTHAGPAGKALLVLGFESAHHPMDEPMRIAVEAAREHGGEPGEVEGASPPRAAPGTRLERGGRRSSRRPICATTSSRSGCCRTRSRPRSRGIGSTTFTTG